MKHTKGRFSIRKHPFIITFIIMAVIAVSSCGWIYRCESQISRAGRRNRPEG